MKQFYQSMKFAKYFGYVLCFLTGFTFLDNVFHGLVMVAVIGVLFGLYLAVHALGREIE